VRKSEAEGEEQQYLFRRGLPQRSAAAATRRIGHRLIRVRNDGHDRHATGEREGEDQNYEDLSHDGSPSGIWNLPEPGLRDRHHVLVSDRG